MNSSLSAARAPISLSRTWRLPMSYGEPLMLTMTSAPAARCTSVGPLGNQMSSQTLMPTRVPAITYTGQTWPGVK